MVEGSSLGLRVEGTAIFESNPAWSVGGQGRQGVRSTRRDRYGVRGTSPR